MKKKNHHNETVQDYRAIKRLAGLGSHVQHVKGWRDISVAKAGWFLLRSVWYKPQAHLHSIKHQNQKRNPSNTEL